MPITGHDPTLQTGISAIAVNGFKHGLRDPTMMILMTS
jgi:hypothetical protein